MSLLKSNHVIPIRQDRLRTRLEGWLERIDWRIPDEIACDLLAFGLCVASIYVTYLIGYAVWYVAYTPGGAYLTGGR